MLPLRSSLLVFVLAGASLAVGCGDAGDAGGQASQDVTSGLVFEAETQPLGGFSYDTGLIPKGSPAQVSLKLAAGGTLKVVAAGDPTAEGLAGKAGGGKLALDLAVTMDGRLKIDSTFKKVDTDLPGLKDVSIPIKGEIAFDPFVLGDGETAKAVATIPETKLPPIPLGSVPGNLEITIAAKSTVTSEFHGTCLSVSDGQASYAGEATTGGTLVLKGQIALDLPAPLNKTIDLGEIEVPIPSSKQALDFGSKAAAGAPDSQDGAACEAGTTASSSSGGSSSGGSSSGGSSSGGSSSGGSTAAPSTNKAMVSIDGESFVVDDISLWSNVSEPGTYDLFIEIHGPGAPVGSDIVISATKTGTLCENTGNYIAYRPAGDTQYMPWTSGASTCGLDIDTLPTAVNGRLTGSFTGTLRGINQSTPKTKSLAVTFDVLRDK